MRRSRFVSLAVVTAVILASSGVVITITTADSQNVQISSVNVTPSDPAPGDTVDLETTIANLEGSNGSVEITDIYVRKTGTAEEYIRIENAGSVASGGSVTIPLPVTFDTTGQKSLRVHVRVEDASGGVRTYQYPLSITVEDANDALLSFTTTDSDSSYDGVAGGTTSVNATVSNSHEQAINGVQLDLSGSGVIDNPDRATGSIASGSDQTFSYDVTFDDTGTQTLTGNVTYTTAEGVTRTTEKSIDVVIEEPVIEADLSVSSISNQSADKEVELTNFGNADLTDVEVTATADGDIVGRTLMNDVEPDSSESATFDIASSLNGTITYTATYTAAGSSHTTTLNDQSTIAGNIRLTSIEMSRTGGGVTIEGDASNIGSTNADSVLLRVQNTANVSPTSPSGEYFIGTIEGSEFATFELTAQTQSDPSSIPVEIEYIVDDERVTKTQMVDVSTNSGPAVEEANQQANGDGSSQEGNPSQGGGLPLMGIGVVLAVLGIIVAFAVYRWRQ